MDVDIDLENLMGYLGEFGKYQRTQFLLHILAALTAGVHMLSLVTVAAVPEHRCLIPKEDPNNPYEWNSNIVRESIPFSKDGKLESCLLYGENNSTYKCNKWVYDFTYYKSSRAIDWDFVCDGRWMGVLAQTVYMFGVFTGAVFLGSLADRIGRKKVFYISAVLQLVFGTSVAFVNEYYTFLVLRYLYGIFGSAGSYITGFVLTMELVGPTKRTVCGITFQASFAGGLLLVAFWGWLISDRVILQAVYGLHSLLLIGHWWLIDESPRWLWAHGRSEEAIAIVHRALKKNGNENLLDREKFLKRNRVRTLSYTEETGGILSLLKSPNLRKRTLNVCLNWFANSLAYYGLSLNTGTLPGNPYLMLFVTGLVEYPSYITLCLFMDKTGRRSMISSFMIVGGLLCIVAGFIPQETSAGSNAVISVVMIGKFFIAGSFAIIYNYTAELFPTVVRNTALGVGSMCARLSGALTPPLALLDSLDKRLPVVVFATVAITSGVLSLFLPETLNQPMPQSLDDGERFGQGDTAFASCLGKNKKKKFEIPLSNVDN